MNKLRMYKLSEAEQLEAIKKVGYNIKFIDNPNIEIIIEAIKNNPFTIEYINPELITQEMLDITKDKCDDKDWNDYNEYFNGAIAGIREKELDKLRFENKDLKKQLDNYHQENMSKKVDASDTEKYNEKVSKSFKTNALEDENKDYLGV